MNSREERLLGVIRTGGRLKTVDIVEKAGMCKVTALKYLNSLKESGLVDFELIGPTKLWYAVNEGGRVHGNEISHIARLEFSELLKRFELMTGKKTVVIMTIEDLVSVFKQAGGR